MKVNPFFEVDGKKYEIKRTRWLESKLDELRKENQVSDEQEKAYIDYVKLLQDYQKFLERFEPAETAYLDDPLDENKERLYLKLKEICDNQYEKITQFELSHEKGTLSAIEEMANKNGTELLLFALQSEPYNLTEKDAKAVWGKFVDHFGVQTSKEWINFMMTTLFDREDEEEDPFLKIARAKQQQRLNQRNGMAKIKK